MSQLVANFTFETLNFLLLVGLLGYAFWRPVRKALEAERERHAAESARIESAQREAASALAAAKAAEAAAASAAREERDKLLTSAQQEAERLLAHARSVEDSMRVAFEAEQQRAREAQAGALTDALAQLAADSLRSLLAQLDGPELDLALTRGACEALRELPAGARREASIESARPLPEAARALLEQALGGPVRARTVRELGAGVRVTTEAGQVDASAASLARRAGEALREAAEIEGRRA